METHFEGLQQARGVIARERVLQDLRILARDAQDLLKATAGDMSDRSKEIRTRLGHTLERATATCKELQGQTVEASKAAAGPARVAVVGRERRGAAGGRRPARDRPAPGGSIGAAGGIDRQVEGLSLAGRPPAS